MSYELIIINIRLIYNYFELKRDIILINMLTEI